MKQHSKEFEKEITLLGKQQVVQITYGDVVLTSEDINSATPSYEANLLKSVMKSLVLDSNKDIPLRTEINFKYGLLVNGEYEYLDYGTYIVYSSERKEDTRSYEIKCYDKMLWSMKDYEKLDITYPCTIVKFINTLCKKLGYTLGTTDFANKDRQLKDDVFDGINYTFRDVLDDLAEATASTIYVKDSTLILGQPNDKDIVLDTENNLTIITEESQEISVEGASYGESPTANATFEENSFKDINVNFGAKYGPINSIVLSRSAGSDNVFLQDEDSIKANGLCELKISDNQIMNQNDRSDYLQEILSTLDGLTYYINDYSSTGIMYLDLLDVYSVKIGDHVYDKCIMLNDEQDITQGLEEHIETNEPEQSETDYKKADKTDQKLNQTTLIVDKQAQQIQGVINQIGDRSDKKTTITADIDGLYSKVIDTEDLTKVAEGLTEVTLENCYPGNILELHIYGNNSVFDGLMPSDTLVPEEGLMPRGDSIIVITDKEGNSKEYNFGDLLVLKQNEETFDEFVLDNNKAYIIRRIDSDGTTLVNEKTEEIGEFKIPLGEDTNTIKIKNYTAKLYVKYAIKSTYTDVFATKVEMNSSIKQTADTINLEVSKKVDNNEIISKINQSAEQIQIDADKISLERKRNQLNK